MHWKRSTSFFSYKCDSIVSANFIHITASGVFPMETFVGIAIPRTSAFFRATTYFYDIDYETFPEYLEQYLFCALNCTDK